MNFTLWAEEKCFDAATMEASGPLVAPALVLVSPQNNNVKNLDIDDNQLVLVHLSPILLLNVMVLALTCLNFINLDDYVFWYNWNSFVNFYTYYKHGFLLIN